MVCYNMALLQAIRQFGRTRDRIIVLAVVPSGRTQVIYADADAPVQAVADVLADDSIASKTMSAFKSKVVSLTDKDWKSTAKRGLGK